MLKAPPPLLLASSSRYRAELLARLRLAFDTAAPGVDETPQPGENAGALVVRLARAKAAALRHTHPKAWIIGSDQVALIGDEIIGKPGDRERAIRQLCAASGREVRFLTAVSLSTPTAETHAIETTTVHFRDLSRDQIERYLDAEPAYDCAGSFKCEGYGITLFEAVDSRDPTALIGLPLIALCRLLREAGYPLP
ncbi:Maf family protein [Sinimarinibacterium thermocellulolyticum]|uniref:7-methyl-GTP pyrophosphatase n=1 Tax=Sinimarinibacterium thermocellulolyticum TaxID=3170016 RepID=A0ABV2AB79_9GAMM